MADLLDALTDKEKETLRLIVRGHDAKTAARELGLSVHTINERLRAARRKLDVTSSREAARLLLESEADASAATPEKLVYEAIGDAAASTASHDPPITALRSNGALWTGGIIAMSLLAATLALALAGAPATDRVVGEPASPKESAQMEDVEASAREWLALADAGDWDASYNLASSKFQAGIAASSWAAAAAGRGEYGDVVNREAMRIDIVQSSGTDYHVVRFRTDFENLRSAFERVTLEYEGGVFKVSGYWIEEQPVADSAPASAARNWLTLVDSQDWEASYAAAGKVFQEPNTVASWQRASELARSPLGAVMAREVVQVEEIASPEAYVLVRFKTDFENRQGVIESVTLQRENGVLKVVGYFIT